MPFTIVRQDITRIETDAVVNAANTALRMGGGVCGAIFSAAGAEKLQSACSRLAPIQTGQAAITPGFNLPAKFIIHAAGPVYCHYNPAESRRLLRSAYLESMNLAREHGCKSIAFPLISAGIYGYPKDEALQVAVDAIREFLSEWDMEVFLTVFDRQSFVISKELMGAVESYIDENYVQSHTATHRRILQYGNEVQFGAISGQSAESLLQQANDGLPEWLEQLDEPFNVMLLRLIDAKGKTDVEVYKRANIDRKLFSKIRTGAKGYLPGKRTILALAIALELTLAETDDLLERAGYALSHSQKFDVIVEFFIVNGRYDIYEINEVLFSCDLPLLGSGS